MKSQASLVVRALRLLDAGGYALALAWSVGGTPSPIGAYEIFLLTLIVPLHTSLLGFFQLYESHRLDGVAPIVRQALSAQFVGLGATAAAFWAIGSSALITDVARFAALSTLALVSMRIGLYAALRLLRRRGYDVRNVCVFGDWKAGAEAAKRFSGHPEWGLRVALVGAGDPEQRQFYSYPDRRFVGDSLEEVLQEEIIDEVLICVKAESLPREVVTIKVCEQYGILGRILVDAPSESTRVEAAPDGALGFAVGERRPELQMQLKRLIDVVASAAALLLLWPVLLIVAVLVRLSSPGPALFWQHRVGLNGRQFAIYKFRTMVQGADTMLPALAHRSVTKGPVFKDPSDWRVTPLGRILRRFSLDELPQIFNVLKGDMSLVGPRPLPVAEAQSIVCAFRKRFTVRPGLTCSWQVSGRSDIDFTSWMKLDLEYIDGWSLWLDAKLILRTFPAVLLGRGAY